MHFYLFKNVAQLRLDYKFNQKNRATGWNYSKDQNRVD
jgi:hypothetical protein